MPSICRLKAAVWHGGFEFGFQASEDVMVGDDVVCRGVEIVRCCDLASRHYRLCLIHKMADRLFFWWKHARLEQSIEDGWVVRNLIIDCFATHMLRHLLGHVLIGCE